MVSSLIFFIKIGSTFFRYSGSSDFFVDFWRALAWVFPRFLLTLGLIRHVALQYSCPQFLTDLKGLHTAHSFGINPE